MSNKTEETNIQCPFYLRSTDLRICCEGYLPNTSMITSFPDKKSAVHHMKACCFRVDGGDCQFAKMLFRKYEDD